MHANARKIAIPSFEILRSMRRVDSFETLVQGARTEAQAGRFAGAVAAFQQALALRPDSAETWDALGSALVGLERRAEAADCFRRALTLAPNYLRALNNLGNLLLRLEQIDDAIAVFRRALAIRNDIADLHINFGIALYRQGSSNAALKEFQTAIRLSPHSAEAKMNEAMALLSLGKFRDGWKQYEFRAGGSETHQHRTFAQPQWRGDTSLKGKTILLHAEQGLGDTIQFARFIPLVIARGAKVLVEAQRPLHTILRTISDAFTLFAPGEPLPPFDLHCPLLSLPLAFNTDVKTIPSTIPYLRADSALVDQWRQKLGGASATPRVGLVWSGNPNHREDHVRSIPFSLFRRLIDGASARFYSLQRDVRPSDQEVLATLPEVTTITGEFDDIAAAMCVLDLVITVDTSICHLAGALGRPAWTLIGFCPDWRWMKSRADSPWYPTMRLFRQPAPADWPSALQQTRTALDEFIAAFPPRA